jgi:hypothetical protein
MNQPDNNRLIRHVHRLAVEIGARPQGSPANHAAAAYIEATFRAAGLEVETQRFDCPDWECQETLLEVLANDTDPDGDPLTLSSLGLPDQGGRAIISGTLITYTPAVSFTGVEVFTYTVSDSQGGFATSTVTITVTRDPPFIASTSRFARGQVQRCTCKRCQAMRTGPLSASPKCPRAWHLGEGQCSID